MDLTLRRFSPVDGVVVVADESVNNIRRGDHLFIDISSHFIAANQGADPVHRMAKYCHHVL